MAKKKKAKETKAKERSSHTVNVRDPRWWPLPKVYKLLLPQFGPSTHFELMEVLKSEELRCVRRPANSSQCEEVPRSFWRDRQFDENWINAGMLDIYGPGAVMGSGGFFYDPQKTRLDGWEFYVLEPEKVWPALAQAATARATEAGKPWGRKSGPKARWQVFVALQFCIAKHENKPLPPSGKLALLCQEKVDCLPDESAVRDLIRKLNRLLGD
jgi:hypothetical protein